jgi:PadR family transcriptional regulator, regulatory protein AphA
MSLDYAILGFLNYSHLTGYDLKKIFDSSVKHFWYADQSQIYRTLSRMMEQGLVDKQVIPGSSRPDRKVYSITPAGRASLHAWLTGPFPIQQPHSGPLIQIFFSGQLSDEELLVRFEMAAEIFKSMLQNYDQVPAQIEEYREMMASPREEYFGLLTLDLGRRTMQAQLDWAEAVIAQIKTNRVPSK